MFKKEMEGRILNLERGITDCDIRINDIRTELINLQIVVKKLKDITEYDSYEYKTELVKKKIKEKTVTEDMLPRLGQTIKFKK